MSNIELIKELRKRTECPIMTCKEALEVNDNDIEKAIEWIRMTTGIARG